MTRIYFYQEEDGEVEIWNDGEPTHEPLVAWREGRGWRALERDSGNRFFLSEREHEEAKNKGLAV